MPPMVAHHRAQPWPWDIAEYHDMRFATAMLRAVWEDDSISSRGALHAHLLRNLYFRDISLPYWAINQRKQNLLVSQPRLFIKDGSPMFEIKPAVPQPMLEPMPVPSAFAQSIKPIGFEAWKPAGGLFSKPKGIFGEIGSETPDTPSQPSNSAQPEPSAPPSQPPTLDWGPSARQVKAEQALQPTVIPSSWTDESTSQGWYAKPQQNAQPQPEPQPVPPPPPQHQPAQFSSRKQQPVSFHAETAIKCIERRMMNGGNLQGYKAPELVRQGGQIVDEWNLEVDGQYGNRKMSHEWDHFVSCLD